MKKDIDELMQKHNLDALLVTGSGQHNPAMVYLTGGGHFKGDLIKLQGSDPILYCYPMERDEAARTGLTTKNLSDYNFDELLKETGGDYSKATAIRYQRMFQDLGFTSGKIGIHGMMDAGSSYAIFSALQQVMPGILITGEVSDAVLNEATATKDETEVKRIRQMGKITTEVVGLTAEFLSSHHAQDGILVRRDGFPLTIGDVKSQIDLWLVERGAENPEGTIFTIGKDAGVPHSIGTSTDYLRLGETIVFDIFPCEKGGGYFYDFTRTWCLGFASEAIMELYDHVLFVFKKVLAELKVGALCSEYQKLTCDLFEQKGHPTIQSHPQTLSGYVHSLGHGVGLLVHERPWFRRNASTLDELTPGMVFTIEPGLYYPEHGLGVRLEDTLYIHPDGHFETLAEYPHDLVIPIK